MERCGCNMGKQSQINRRAECVFVVLGDANIGLLKVQARLAPIEVRLYSVPR